MESPRTGDEYVDQAPRLESPVVGVELLTLICSHVFSCTWSCRVLGHGAAEVAVHGSLGGRARQQAALQWVVVSDSW